MRGKLVGVLVCTVVAIVMFLIVNQGTQAQENQGQAIDASDSPPAQQSSAERGRYLVHHVAMCIYCHTPRNEEGVPDEQRLLQGAPMPVASPFPRQQWAFQAPKIAGLPGGWTEADMVNFLQTGQSPSGRHPRPPMPPFRFTEQDAQSVAAYLKSLE